MGAHCPKCKSHQAFKRTLTVDQLPARKAVDVLGFELSCGHKYGNDEFMKIQETVNKIKSDYAKKFAELEQSQQEALAKALEVMQGGKGLK